MFTQTRTIDPINQVVVTHRVRTFCKQSSSSTPLRPIYTHLLVYSLSLARPPASIKRGVESKQRHLIIHSKYRISQILKHFLVFSSAVVTEEMLILEPVHQKRRKSDRLSAVVR